MAFPFSFPDQMLSEAPLHYYFITFRKLRYISETDFPNREPGTSESLLCFVSKAVRIFWVNVGQAEGVRKHLSLYKLAPDYSEFCKLEIIQMCFTWQ